MAPAANRNGMRGTRPAVKRAWLGGLACAGVAAAHWIAYLLAPPRADAHAHGHTHGEALAATGHDLWPYLVAVAAGAFVAALSGFVSDRVGESRGASGASLWRHAAARLVPVQVLAFAGLELLERVLFADSGHAGSLLGQPVLWVGIALQVLCALGGAGLLVVFARTIEIIQKLVARRLGAGTSGTAVAGPRRISLPVRAVEMATGGPTFRGPPALL